MRAALQGLVVGMQGRGAVEQRQRARHAAGGEFLFGLDHDGAGHRAI
jgi:hypothetical protein